MAKPYTQPMRSKRPKRSKPSSKKGSAYREYKPFDTILTFVPFLDGLDSNENIIDEKRMKKAYRKGTGKYRPCVIISTDGDSYTVAQCRSALNNKWPPRVALSESEKAGFISNTSVCTSTEQLLYFKKDLTPQMRKLGHLTEKDRQIFADAYYYENHVQPTPKPSTVKLAHIKAKQSNQSIKARYYDKVEMDY
jgi:hypothetical protein